jgi:hypothetical protein
VSWFSIQKRLEKLNEINGLHFASSDQIELYYNHGMMIHEITIPDDADVMIGNDRTSLKTNKMIIVNSYSLADPNTYNELGLNITKNYYLMREICRLGDVEKLNLWSELKYLPPQINLRYMFHIATINEDVDVLNWLGLFCQRLNIAIPECNKAISIVAEKGNMTVIKWWANVMENRQRLHTVSTLDHEQSSNNNFCSNSTLSVNA